MGLFDIFKNKRNKKIRVEMYTHEPSKKEMKEDWKRDTQERIRNFQKDEAGLYPQEILMLSYLEKYAAGKEPARFWERQYGVDDVNGLISSLEKRGFAKNGKLTDLGKSEIKKNEYVQYMHRHSFPDISMADMSILVNKNTDINYRDLLWSEFNRLSGEYISNRKFGLYRNNRYTMYKFLIEEKKYTSAFTLLAETVLFDLNGDKYPCVPPAIIDDLKSIEAKIDYTDEQMIDLLQHHFERIYYPVSNFSIEEVICIIVAYSFGHDEMAESIIAKK